MRRRARRALSLDIAQLGFPSSPGPSLDGLAVRDALALLPLRIRTAVVLHYMVGQTIAEVAGSMGVSENTVKSQVRVGAAKLREILGDE
jgi:RNA polymerase sigma-70 factor (ECF subfamily)